MSIFSILNQKFIFLSFTIGNVAALHKELLLFMTSPVIFTKVLLCVFNLLKIYLTEKFIMKKILFLISVLSIIVASLAYSSAVIAMDEVNKHPINEGGGTRPIDDKPGK